jgi:hypothetical protein
MYGPLPLRLVTLAVHPEKWVPVSPQEYDMVMWDRERLPEVPVEVRQGGEGMWSDVNLHVSTINSF